MKFLAKILIVTSLVVFYNSCGEDTVDLLPPFPTENQFYNTQADFQASVFAVYQKQQDFYRYNGNNSMGDMFLAPDDNTRASDNASFDQYNFFQNLNTTEADLNRYYTLAYQLIARANIVLLKIDENGDVYDEPALQNVHRAEVRFLRGLTFFRLWNYFGPAPVVKEVFADVGDAAAVTNSSGNELLDAAIEDFTFAKANLPASWPAESVGRATSGAASGFLGKVLAFRGIVSGNNADLTSAISEFSGLSGYSLIDDFGGNFDETQENNPESLFEVQFSENVQGNNIWLPIEGFPANGDIGGYWGLFDGSVRFGGPTLAATPGLDDVFEDGDPRVAETYDPSTGEILKYVNRPSSDGTIAHLFNNARALRYADVLLLHAWAIAESGGSLSTAIGLVNQVRTRARQSGGAGSTVPADHSTTETDPQVVLNWILDERRMELAFEESHRWFDLRLLHLTDRMDLTSYDFGDPGFGYDFDDHEIVFAFPDQEVETTALNQNAGYN